MHFQMQILFIISCTITSFSYGQQLKANYLSTKLPLALNDASAVYDGEDTIYILGGSDPMIVNDKILRFSISSETIEVIGALPNYGVYGGSAHFDSEGNLFYFGGFLPDVELFSAVYKYNPTTNISIEVGQLTHEARYGTSVKYNDTIFLFGGFGKRDTIQIFDMKSLTTRAVGTLPQEYFSISSIGVDRSAYIFGFQITKDVPATKTKTQNLMPTLAKPHPKQGATQIVKVDIFTLQTEFAPDNNFPEISGFAYPVFDGKHAYFVGGQLPSSQTPTDSIIQFDPETFQHTTIHVDNFLVSGSRYFLSAPSAVFVQKLNRVYLFGGYSADISSGDGEFHQDIWYIDLNPDETTQDTPEPEPTQTTTDGTISTTLIVDPHCENRPDGMYPHPSDCAKFIGCRNGTSEIYTCPAPLLFNPILLVCDYPENVMCDQFCLNKPDGLYPDPTDCSLFIGCHDGVPEFFECPPPLLFDPVLGTCNFPELVVCLE